MFEPIGVNLFSREEYFDKIFRKSGSFGSLKVADAAIKLLDRYCQEIYGKHTDVVLAEIRELLKNNPNDATPMLLLDKYANYAQKIGKRPSSIQSYTNQCKKYFRQCGGIRISSDDMKDYVTMPVSQEEEEDAEPLTHDEIRQILENCKTQSRKALYMVLKDSGARIGEILQVRKRHFDLTKDPATLTLPKNITKGKKRKRIQRLSHETVKVLETVLKKCQDDDSPFGSDVNNVEASYKKEYSAFDYIREQLGFTEKYSHNGRYKKNLHSIRSFCYTQSKLATGDADYAHGYVGHDKYLIVYERIEEKEKDELFNKCVSRLSIFEDVVVLSPDDANQKIENLQKDVAHLTGIIENIIEHPEILRAGRKK